MDRIQSLNLSLILILLCIHSYNETNRNEQLNKQLQIIMEIEKTDAVILEEFRKNLNEIKYSMEQVHWSIENERK